MLSRAEPTFYSNFEDERLIFNVKGDVSLSVFDKIEEVIGWGSHKILNQIICLTSIPSFLHTSACLSSDVTNARPSFLAS